MAKLCREIIVYEPVEQIDDPGVPMPEAGTVTGARVCCAICGVWLDRKSRTGTSPNGWVVCHRCIDRDEAE